MNYGLNNLNFLTMIKHGWVPYTYYSSPDVNSRKCVFILLKDGRILQGVWATTSKDGGYGYEVGKFYLQDFQFHKENDIDDQVIMWIEEEKLIKNLYEGLPPFETKVCRS